LALRAAGFVDTGCGITSCVAAGKTLQKMLESQAGWRIEELQMAAEANLVEWRRPGRGGSDVIFSAPGVREIVPAPARRPIKPVYIKQFPALVDAAREVGDHESTFESRIGRISVYSSATISR